MSRIGIALAGGGPLGGIYEVGASTALLGQGALAPTAAPAPTQKSLPEIWDKVAALEAEAEHEHGEPRLHGEVGRSGASRKRPAQKAHARALERLPAACQHDTRERKAALLALEQLAHTKEGITPSHKHMFRDFGVRLRQNSQPDLALLFTRKAVELAPEDDHAHFNLARILCSLGMYDEAAAHVATALSVSSEEPLYFKLLEHIRELKQARSAAKAASKR